MANLIEIWIWNSYTWIYLVYKYVIMLNIFLSFPAFWGSFKEKFVFKSTKYQISDSDHTLLKQLWWSQTPPSNKYGVYTRLTLNYGCVGIFTGFQTNI